MCMRSFKITGTENVNKEDRIQRRCYCVQYHDVLLIFDKVYQ